jgi:hypothetical protein
MVLAVLLLAGPGKALTITGSDIGKVRAGQTVPISFVIEIEDEELYNIQYFSIFLEKECRIFLDRTSDCAELSNIQINTIPESTNAGTYDVEIAINANAPTGQAIKFTDFIDLEVINENDQCFQLYELIQENYLTNNEIGDVNNDGIINLIDLGIFGDRQNDQVWCEEQLNPEESTPNTNGGGGGGFSFSSTPRTSTTEDLEIFEIIPPTIPDQNEQSNTQPNQQTNNQNTQNDEEASRNLLTGAVTGDQGGDGTNWWLLLGIFLGALVVITVIGIKKK